MKVMAPRLLVIETSVGDACLSVHSFLSSCNYTILLASITNKEDITGNIDKYCSDYKFKQVQTNRFQQMSDSITVPRLGFYASFDDQLAQYLQFYPDECMKVRESVEYVIDHVAPSHILVNIGLVNMYNVFTYHAVKNYFNNKNVFYYTDKPYSLKRDYSCVNTVSALPKVKKLTLSPQEIAKKLEVFTTYFNSPYLETYSDVMTYPEELLK